MLGFLQLGSYLDPCPGLPPIGGRLLTRYGVFWYHSVSKIPKIHRNIYDLLPSLGSSSTSAQCECYPIVQPVVQLM